MRRICLVEPSPAVEAPASIRTASLQTPRKPSNGSVHKPRQPKPVLAAEPSAALRDQLLAEIADLNHSDDLALWAHRRLPAKNTLAADDARAVEAAYQACARRRQPRCPRVRPTRSRHQRTAVQSALETARLSSMVRRPTVSSRRPPHGRAVPQSRSGGETRPILPLSPHNPAWSANARRVMRII